MQGATSAEERWAAARGPAAATILTCFDMGWRMQDFHTIAPAPAAAGAAPPAGQPPAAGRQIDLLKVCPQDVVGEAKEVLGEIRLEDWASGAGREGLRPRPWLAPLRQLQEQRMYV